jgi:hypothetical protein
MKNRTGPGFSARRRSRQALATMICLGFSLPLAAQKDTAATGPADACYEFFMGTDVEVPFKNTELPMVDFRNGLTILTDKGTTVSQPFAKVERLSLKRAPKLSRDLVEVSDFKAEETVSPNNAGLEQMMQLMLLQDNASDVQRFSERFKSAADSFAQENYEPHLMPDKMPPPPQGPMAPNPGPGSKMSSPVNEVNQMQQNDAIDIRFKASSREPLEDAYVLVVALIRESIGDNVPRQWVRFERIGRLGPEAKSVHITQSGLPKGYVIDETSLFFFTHGVEIANTLSSKRISVSTDEARLILNTDYVASNQNKTRPPTLAIASIPDSVVARLKDAGVNREAVLHLDAEALVTSAECAGKPVSDEALALFRTILFHPGLKDGQPVPATVKIDVSQFSKSNMKLTTRQ